MSAMRIRRLNEEGIQRFTLFLDSQTGEMPQDYAEARAWLTSGETSEGVSGVADADPREVFSRRFDLAAYLHERIPALKLPDATRDAGLWTWLALLWFEQLCPADKNGRRTPLKHYAYIPDLGNFQTYYRHRILGPYLIFATHADEPERAMCMLCQPIPKHPDTAEQLASRQDIIQSPALVGIATHLYFNRERGLLWEGATSYSRKKGTRRGDKKTLARPGTVRRLVEVCWQLDRTYDHLDSSTEQFKALLPEEFSRFGPKPDR